MKNNKKSLKLTTLGFTLVELLAVIVVLGVILAIAIPNVLNIIEKSRIDVYENNKKLVEKATINYLIKNPDLLPKLNGNVTFIRLDELVQNNKIDIIKDPKDNSNCNMNQSIVKIKNNGNNKYEYETFLTCNNYKSSDNTPPLIKLELIGNQLSIVGYDESGLFFNGLDGYIKLPTINNIRAIELKLYLFQYPTTIWRYILDARNGLINGWIAEYSNNSSSIGLAWVKMYINGIERLNIVNSIPKHEIVNVYFEANQNFIDDINIFSRVSNNEFNLGNIYEIRIWSNQVAPEIVYDRMNKNLVGNEEGLLAYYKLDKLEGNILKDNTINNNHAIVHNAIKIVNSGIKQIRIKRNGAVIDSSNNFSYNTTLSSGTYIIEIEDNVGNINPREIAIP